MATSRMEKRENRRKKDENYVDRCHLKLKDLSVKAGEANVYSKYLYKTNIPSYPRPEFLVSRLKHDTNQEGLKGIRKEGGFKNPFKKDVIPYDSSLVWFSLVVGPEEIEAAERRLLKTTYPDRTKEQIQNQQSLLEKFATSPVFLRSSRYGPYRFTFSVEEVLKAYRDQFCSGAEPVMRVMETVLYKQEVMYVVLVHSPADKEQFSKYPRLADNPDPICTYKKGKKRFMWRSQAMCETHRFKLVQHKAEKMMGAVKAKPPKNERPGYKHFYVWDHVTIALHVGDQVLTFDDLREKLTLCEKGDVPLVSPEEFLTAESVLAELWPDNPSDEERAPEVPEEDQDAAKGEDVLIKGFVKFGLKNN